MNRRQKNPAVYRLAADDSDFLRSDVMRGTHLLLEYSKAEVQLEAWDIASTVVVFGSARARPTRNCPSCRTGMRRRAASAASCPSVAGRCSRKTACAAT